MLSQKHYASSPTITLARFRQGLRQCGPTSDGLVFVRHFGVADCLTAEDGHAVCDLYVGGAAGGASNFVLGRADFYRDNVSGTNAEYRVRKMAAHNEATLEAWDNFSSGNASNTCE
ncbi:MULTISPECIES: hypothetical protein [unclassified Caballeronia]|uniref:hypothetical protein n=1 Tax=unclassified Caballeronia TaxID=2646786 RepID=UPI002029B217|nr:MULTISPECIES: hypothetical protein [unclassified Caballeronia]